MGWLYWWLGHADQPDAIRPCRWRWDSHWTYVGGQHFRSHWQLWHSVLDVCVFSPGIHSVHGGIILVCRKTEGSQQSWPGRSLIQTNDSYWCCVILADTCRWLFQPDLECWSHLTNSLILKEKLACKAWMWPSWHRGCNQLFKKPFRSQLSFNPDSVSRNCSCFFRCWQEFCTAV